MGYYWLEFLCCVRLVAGWIAGVLTVLICRSLRRRSLSVASSKTLQSSPGQELAAVDPPPAPPPPQEGKDASLDARRREYISHANPDSMFNAHRVQLNGQRLLPMSLDYVDMFLKWRCSRPLLEMGLFPDSKEIMESVACMEAVRTHLKDVLSFSDVNITCAVIGDGARPRTAALACFLTKWRRVISVDPGLKASEQSIHRLELRAKKIQDTVVDVDPRDSSIVLILPHAHVCPNVALACLQFPAQASLRPLPRIVVVQLPCCDYEYHDRCVEMPPDHEYSDMAIGSSRRLVRIWRDVASAAVAAKAVGMGNAKAIVKTWAPYSCSMDRRGWKATRREKMSKGGLSRRQKRELLQMQTSADMV